MSRSRLSFIIITGWFIALASVLSARFALGTPVTLVQGVSLLIAFCVPALVLLVVFRGTHGATQSAPGEVWAPEVNPFRRRHGTR